jgi:hypothetical protein
MMDLTKCGYCCEACKAYAPNIERGDQREELSRLWKLYYALDIPAKDIYCDGCLSTKLDAKRIDDNCPVRQCVVEEKLSHCGECSKYPCETFCQRKGLTEEEMKKHPEYESSHYREYLMAFDNKTRLDEYRIRIK